MTIMVGRAIEYIGLFPVVYSVVYVHHVSSPWPIQDAVTGACLWHPSDRASSECLFDPDQPPVLQSPATPQVFGPTICATPAKYSLVRERR